jgi:type II secretory ATPase GspE/PulE/Tfp pilus assembly ATPase PilB-like protein
MVGEIRDNETAVMAIQSALTGHLVFSTLHTNDAASAVTRILDLGIEPYLVSSSLLAVLAQRLVRKVCPDCVEQRTASKEELAFLQQDNLVSAKTEIARGRGCSNCRDTGYRGRIGIFELLSIDDQVRARIQDRSNASDIRDTARERGMQLLRDDGVVKVLRGSTTVEEVSRVTVRSTM